MAMSPLINPAEFGMTELSTVERPTNLGVRKIALVRYATGDVLIVTGIVSDTGEVGNFDMKKAEKADDIIRLLGTEGGVIQQVADMIATGTGLFESHQPPC